ncbi:MAG TPA: DNA-binding response regulator [Puia sp.]|nr:DNA-binding response regulator [Puia sp.]
MNPPYRVLSLVPGYSECGTLTTGLKEIAEMLSIKNTAEAFRVLETRIIHLMIVEDSDNSYEFCLRIKGFTRYAHIPVLVLMPRDSLLARLRWLRAGADACLEMPVSRPYLLAQVDNLLVNRVRLRDHFGASGISQREASQPGPGADAALWERLNRVIVQQLSNAALDVSQLARELHMSRPTLYRKITEISKMTPAALITQCRLDMAASLLASTGHPVTEVSRMVGFCTRNGLGKAFVKRFGVSPTEYRRKAAANQLPGMVSEIFW